MLHLQQAIGAKELSPDTWMSVRVAALALRGAWGSERLTPR